MTSIRILISLTAGKHEFCSDENKSHSKKIKSNHVGVKKCRTDIKFNKLLTTISLLTNNSYVLFVCFFEKSRYSFLNVRKCYNLF